MRPIQGIPEGAKVKIRMRNNDCAKVYVKVNGSVSQYFIKVIGTQKDGDWVLFGPLGVNTKPLT